MSDEPADGCVDCTGETEHCHWAWVRHPDGHGECLALACRFGPDAHVIVVACADVHDDACCTSPDARAGPRGRPGAVAGPPVR